MAKTFSESWHQVSHLKFSILPTVKVHKQLYRGEVWYVLQDSCSEKYYRLRPHAYAFAMTLSEERTFEECWLSYIEKNPEDAPSQEEAIQLVAQLHHANLLQFRSTADHDLLYKRYQKTQEKEWLSKLMAFLYIRIPMWNPNQLLKDQLHWMKWLFGAGFFSFWFIVVLWGAQAAFDRSDDLWTEGQGILSIDNLMWLYISLFVLKFFHEMGHAIACKTFGAEVNTMGIMFIVFAPLPYVDATSSWTMRNRWQRVIVGAAGMYVELFFAAIAAVIWANTADGFIHSMAFNIMVIGSLSSLLFNGNPLLRFDAYYILSDLLDIPNMYQKANQQWMYYFDRFLLGTPNAHPQSEDAREVAWLTAYGISSYFYRLFVMLVIMVYVADVWLGLALLVLIVTALIWFIIPVGKLLKYLLTSPKLELNRTRAWLASFATAVFVVGVVGWLPLPYALEAEGVVKSQETTQIYMQSGGQLKSLYVKSGESVQKGTLIAVFEDRDLATEIELVKGQIKETDYLLRRAISEDNRDTQAIKERQYSLMERYKDLEQKKQALTIIAPHSGLWASNGLAQRLESIFGRGELVGQIVNPDKMHMVALVSQEQSSDLFQKGIDEAEIKLLGQASETLLSTHVKFIPFETHSLPSDALTIQGGGEILATANERGQLKTKEPYFEVVAKLPASDLVRFSEGQMGRIQVDLPWRSGYDQMSQTVQQIMQKRYQL